MKNINNPKGQADDYSKIFNALLVFSIIGIFFIVGSIPALAEPPEEEELNYKIKPHSDLTITFPDVSYAIELKQNSETAQESIANAQTLIDKALNIKLPRMFEVADAYEQTYVGEFYITMYAATVEQCGNSLGITASGRPCSSDPTCWTVAVDPAVIPLGTYLIIEGYEGIIFRADDTGSAINGYDIDIYTDSEAESKSFNNQSGVKVWILEDYG